MTRVFENTHFNANFLHKNYSIIISVASLKIFIMSLTRTCYRSKGLFKAAINIHTNRIDYIIRNMGLSNEYVNEILY